MDIGNKIRILRLQNNLTQQELSKIIGVSDKAISTWENGTKTPRMGAIEKLSSYFGVSKSFLIEDSSSEQSVLSLILTPQESELIRKYRSLDLRGKKAVDDTINREYEFFTGAQNNYVSGTGN